MIKESNESKKASYILLIQSFYKKNGRVPRRKELQHINNGVVRQFGTWNNAIKNAGFEIFKDTNPSKVKLRNSLIQFYAKHKRAPKTKECTKANGLHDPRVYIKFLEVKDWPAVLRKVGLGSFLQTSKLIKDKDKAFKAIISFIKKEKIKDSQEYKRLAKLKGLPSLDYIYTSFGGWNNLLITAGLKRVINKELIVKEIKRYYKKEKQAPTLEILARRFKVPIWQIQERTGSYNRLLKELQLPLNKKFVEKSRLSKEELQQLYINFSKKNGFINGASFRAVNESGELPGANVFIRQFGSMNDLRKACGFTPVKESNGYTREMIINLLKKEYLLFRRPLTTTEIMKDAHLPAVRTILRYLDLPSLKEVWIFIRNVTQTSR